MRNKIPKGKQKLLSQDIVFVSSRFPLGKTPGDFAERYIQREIYKPSIANISSLLYLPHSSIIKEIERIYKKSYQDKLLNSLKIPIKPLEESLISPDIKRNICIALHEFTRALNIDLESLRKLNKELVKKKTEALISPGREQKGTFFGEKSFAGKKTEKNKEYDENNNPYPYKEIDLISSWSHIFYSGLYRKVMLKVEARRIKEMLSVPISISKERLMKFFSQVLQIVIFKYVYKYAENSQQKAKHLTAEIINSYMKSIGFEHISRLRGDIDKALR